jgi:hypothetical protein
MSHVMSLPRPIHPCHFQADLIWWDSPFKASSFKICFTIWLLFHMICKKQRLGETKHNNCIFKESQYYLPYDMHLQVSTEEPDLTEDESNLVSFFYVKLK